MSKLVPPHGSDALAPLLLPHAERADAAGHASRLEAIPMSSRELSDLLMLGMGAYTPLDGFMGHDDWRGSCADMKLTSGVFWPIPITVSCAEDLADSIALGETVALACGETGERIGTLRVEEKYRIDARFECEHVYGTTDEAHPGVQKVLAQPPVNLAGRVSVFSESDWAARFPDLYLHPAQSRALFQKKGWSRVAAFQTRNPMHRSHEYLAKIAVEVTDGVFIHQVLGRLKPGDIPASVRTRAIQAMIDNYFVADTVVQAGYPIEMRYGGPREALLHALIRQNFGCSHLIVGRDHAGVGDYYGPHDAQHAFDELWEGALATRALKVDNTFFCRRCDGMATGRTCPHGREHHVTISGTRQREMLSSGEPIPSQFSRPEVVAILEEFYAGRSTAE